MSSGIKAGDQCEIVEWCCASGEASVGSTVLVEIIERSSSRCPTCGNSYSAPTALIRYDSNNEGACPLAWLRKRPPKSGADGEPRTDFVPAETEFTEDLRRQLHRHRVPASGVDELLREAERLGVIFK